MYTIFTRLINALKVTKFFLTVIFKYNVITKRIMKYLYVTDCTCTIENYREYYFVGFRKFRNTIFRTNVNYYIA